MKKKFRILICIALIIATALSVSCSNKASKSTNTSKMQLDTGDNIVFCDKYLEDYIKKSDKGISENLFNETVFQPIKKEYSVDARALFDKTIEDTKGLEKDLEFLRKEKGEIEGIIEKSLVKCKEMLHASEKFSIYVLVEDPKIYKMFRESVRAMTPESGIMILVVSPSQKDYKEKLQHVIAHEYCHSMDKSCLGESNMLDSIISEGKAESFANIAFPEGKSRLSADLSRDEELKVWTEIKDKLSSKDGSFIGPILNGTKEGVPEFAGYRLGNKIVKQFIQKNPNTSIQQWINMKPKELFEKSQYVDNWN